MNSRPNQKPVLLPRVKLTEHLINHLTEDIMGSSVGALAKRTGLPYLLIYNIAHRRVKSLSARNYRIIFGEAPPLQEQKKMDGTRFREMVELWLFLNAGVTKSDLFKEFYGRGHTKRVDYRIFTGQTQSVDPGFVKHMQNEFMPELRTREIGYKPRYISLISWFRSKVLESPAITTRPVEIT
jgi:hypothetical protein